MDRVSNQERDFVAMDPGELLDIRAGQRTFDGAYLRSSLATLSFATVILKLFDKQFYRIGLLYSILSALLFILSIARAHHSKLQFRDDDGVPSVFSGDIAEGGRRRTGKLFVTAGGIVVLVSTAVAIMEVGVIWLVLAP